MDRILNVYNVYVIENVTSIKLSLVKRVSLFLETNSALIFNHCLEFSGTQFCHQESCKQYSPLIRMFTEKRRSKTPSDYLQSPYLAQGGNTIVEDGRKVGKRLRLSFTQKESSFITMTILGIRVSFLSVRKRCKRSLVESFLRTTIFWILHVWHTNEKICKKGKYNAYVS